MKLMQALIQNLLVSSIFASYLLPPDSFDDGYIRKSDGDFDDNNDDDDDDDDDASIRT